MNNKHTKRLVLIGSIFVPLLARSQDTTAIETHGANPAIAVSTDNSQVNDVSKPAVTVASPESTTDVSVVKPAVVSTDATTSEHLSELTATPAPVVAPVAPVTPAIAEPTKLKDTLSVDFPDEEIRSILRNVADLFELNIIIPDTLQGRTSIKLRDVTWRQIYTVLLSPAGYTFVEEGNIIKIVSKGSLDAEPFVTSSVVLQNIAAGTIEPVLKSLLTTAQAATQTTPLVLGGSLVLNAQSNEYIITDKPVVVQRVIDTAKRMDSEPKQVVIETKFVEVTDVNALDLSLKTEGRMDLNKPFGANQVGGINTFNQAPISPITTLLSGPSGAGATGAFNAVLSTKDYSVLLQALQSKSDTKVVSNPTIVAVNGSKSLISVGKEFQLVKKTQSGAGATAISTTEKDGVVFEGIKVEVTPQITSRKLVSLLINANKTIASESASKGEGQIFYDISKREANLNMLLQDGQTAAIGGLLDKKADKFSTKVPLLGDIPIIGNLFKTKKNTDQNTNLIIFITANILEPSKTTYKNVSTSEQLYDLNLTERDIRGISYEKTADESQLYDQVAAKRQAEQDAKLHAKLKGPAQKTKTDSK